MAGTGPAPAEQRRRRNEPARGEWIDLAPIERPVIPDLPEIEGGWREVTKKTWEAWQADPVTTQWSPSDIAYALDTILLHNGMTASTANEVRLRMDALGLTPKGKRDLRWRIGTEGGAEQAPKARPKGKRSANDRRARLTVVK